MYVQMGDVLHLRSARDVEWYLVSHLKLCETEHSETVTYENELYTYSMGFRRAFCMHCVYRNDVNNKYAFHVGETLWNGLDGPNLGMYDSFAEMLQKVSLLYAVAWRLDAS